MVPAGSELVSILPADGNLEIHLLAESKAIGFVRKGIRVLLRYAAFPYQKFGQYPGMITDVSQVTVANDLDTSVALSQQKQAPRYRITVQPDSSVVMAYGKPEPLRAGMAVEADLLLDTRPLYQWLFEPLYSLHGKITGQALRDAAL
ncbi:HlyD family efflux transporter periplasmic adaptor subunit [Phyllobacterium salinisoli]|nr:HlyD family efflux transporter periplasmic adaptor subunit [Phyllobacterium salinisoli]